VPDQLQLAIANYRKGSYITVEGKQKVECFFIIQQGSVRISREAGIEGDKDEALVAGDFFGVASAMSSLSHIETAVAASDVTLITVRPHQYVSLIQRNSQVAIKILMQLSSRLRFLDAALAALTARQGEAPLAEDGPARLFAMAEYCHRQKRAAQASYAYARYLEHFPSGKSAAAAASRLEALAGAGQAKRAFGKGEMSRAYEKGEVIFAEGEPGSEFFVLQSGSVRISKIVDGKEMLLGAIKAGDIFGEMALLESKHRAASVVAAGEGCTVMAVGKSGFELLIQTQPQLIAKLTTLLASRIWSAFKQLEVLSIINPLGRVYAALLISLEKSRIGFDSTAAHVFSSTWEDLIGTLGLSEKEGFILLGELRKDKNIQVSEGMIQAASVREVVRQCEFYRKMDAREKVQQESRLKNQAE